MKNKQKLERRDSLENVSLEDKQHWILLSQNEQEFALKEEKIGKYIQFFHQRS